MHNSPWNDERRQRADGRKPPREEQRSRFLSAGVRRGGWSGDRGRTWARGSCVVARLRQLRKHRRLLARGARQENCLRSSEAHGGTFFWLVLTKGLLTRGASESGRRRDASIPSRAMPAETTTGRLPAVAMEGRDIPALDYGKLLDLFHGKHSAGLHDRHAAAIARVCRAHAGGFPIRDLPSIERIVRFAYDRVAQGLVGEFEEALVLVMRCGSRPASTAHSPTCDDAPFPPSSSPLIAHDAHPHRSRSSLSA